MRKETAGISSIDLLTLLFIGLKLTGLIAWPWLWVLSLLWVPAAGLLLLMLIVYLKIKIWDN